MNNLFPAINDGHFSAKILFSSFKFEYSFGKTDLTTSRDLTTSFNYYLEETSWLRNESDYKYDSVSLVCIMTNVLSGLLRSFEESYSLPRE